MCSKPGEKALQAMKDLNKKVVMFKTPTVPQKRKSKVKILTEEKYVEEMGKIIQRDFFPDLEKLKAQNQYLDAIERNDIIKLRELYAKYSKGRPKSTLREGSESPATFETPASSGMPSTPDPRSVRSNKSTKSRTSNSGESTSSSSIDGHSLDSFLQTHTSEDNHSFHEIIEAADRKLRQKFAVLFDAEKLQAIEMENALALPSIEKQFDVIEDRPKAVDTWTYKNKNYVMYVPDGVALTQEEEIEAAKRKMEINHSNTRLQSNPFDDQQSKETITEIAKSHTKGMAGKIGVDGNTLAASLTPQIHGFSFVKTPSPRPGVNESPLMTWGEIEGTPFRLDGGDTPVRPSTGPAFRIAENTRRETIAFELAEKAGERMRGQKAKAIEAAKRNIKSPYVRSSIDRLATMSPAARRLASVKFGLKDSIIGTPSPLARRPIRTPLVTPKCTPSPKTSVNRNKTPGPQTPSNVTITDDLLKIPEIKRPRAADFF